MYVNGVLLSVGGAHISCEIAVRVVRSLNLAGLERKRN